MCRFSDPLGAPVEGPSNSGADQNSFAFAEWQVPHSAETFRVETRELVLTLSGNVTTRVTGTRL